MKTLALGLCLAVLAAAPAAQAAEPLNTLSATEKAQGWKLLFDGKTTAGWRDFKAAAADPGWKVKDGILFVEPNVARDLITTEKYADFELTFDWRIGKLGNSGVFYHVIEEGQHAYETGPEYQLLDNHRSEPPLEQAAGLFGLYAPAKDVTKPVGEFNHGRLIARHGHVEHWLNGVKVTEYEIGSADFKAKVAGTKFHAWPLFATGATGYIGLQNHGDDVAFTNIKIKVLP